MRGHRRGTSFIRYVLPVWAGGKPPKPEAPEEQGGKGKPKPTPMTTLALGEESGTARPGSIISRR